MGDFLQVRTQRVGVVYSVLWTSWESGSLELMPDIDSFPQKSTFFTSYYRPILLDIFLHPFTARSNSIDMLGRPGLLLKVFAFD